jgi:hypothetical protein
MAEPGYGEALRLLAEGAALSRVLAAAAGPLAMRDPVLYLVDFSGQVLLPVSGGAGEEAVEGTLAGRAFTTGQPVTGEHDGMVRVWVPVTEQATRTGVLAVTVAAADPALTVQAGLLGAFAGLAVAALARISDVPYVRRLGREMSLPAVMQWDLLPPLSTRVPGAVVAGLLEPAYDIAGDAFDYAAGDGMLHVAIFDGLGHGIGSTLLTGLAVGAYRHRRRRGEALPDIHRGIDQALADHYGDDSFATGIVAVLNTGSGRLEWTRAGHPLPLLLRGRKVVAELDGPATLPWGLNDGAPELGSCDLEPGDMVLLYTDGVTEAHAPGGELFGLDRLTDLLEREAAGGQSPEELLRRLVRALLDHQPGGLRDDATLLLVHWTGP